MQKKDLLKIYFALFEISRKANIVCVLREKLEGSVIKRWLFISIPIFFYAVNIYIIISQDAFWNKCIKLSFVKDMSNSLVLTVLFFISYFLSYYFPSLFSTQPTRHHFSATEVRFFHGFHIRIRSTRCPRGFHQICGESFHHPSREFPRDHPGRQFFHGISRFGGDSAACLACRGDSATSLFKETPAPNRRVDSRGTWHVEFAVARDLCSECVPAE